jgi:periplasmic protein TonB
LQGGAKTIYGALGCIYSSSFTKKACRNRYYQYNDNHSHYGALVMAITYRQTQIHNGWKGGAGAAFTVAVHAVVIALLLLARNQISSEAAPLAVTIFADAPQQNKEQPIIQRPVLSTTVATLRVPQPEILLADNAPSNAIAVTTSAPSTSAVAKLPPAPTQPRFDADYLNNPAPRYPALSRRLREEGVVMLRVYVLPNGLPDTVELKRSSGSARLDESALMAVRQWRFLPARSGDIAVAAWVVVPIAFSLAA